MQKFNKRRKLDRFLSTLPEGMVFKSNNEFRIKMPNGYIGIGYYYHTYHAFGGHRNSEYNTIQENIDAVKELIDKYGKGEQDIDKVFNSSILEGKALVSTGAFLLS